MQKEKKIRICVTGATGFIGESLIEYIDKEFKDANYEILIFKGNLLNKLDILNFFNENRNIDKVLYLVGTFSANFNELININVLALNNMLEAMAEFNIKSIIYTSTGAVYGEPILEHSKEDDELNPNTLYGLSKKMAEDTLIYYEKLGLINYIILRLPNVYGKLNKKGVIFNFINGIKESKIVAINGNGLQTRNFLYIDDLCSLIVLLFDYNKKSDIFNVSFPQKYSLLDLVSILSKYYDFSVKYIQNDNTNNLKDLSLDINKIKKKLNWHPIYSLEDGLKKLL